MSELPVAATGASDDELPPQSFEQWLFDVSPVGALPTSIAIFVLLFGAFELCAFITHYPLTEQMSLNPQEGAWAALVLSLLAAVALGMQRYVTLKYREDAPALDKVLPDNTPKPETPAERQAIRWLGIAGAVLGCAASFAAVPSYVRTDHLIVFLWFAFAMSLLGGLFFRGAMMTRIRAREFGTRVERSLTVNLLHIDELNVIGRASARAALIWLSVAAVVCLFFASGQTRALVIVMVAVSAGMGAWLFFRSLVRVHKKILIAKQAELVRVRHQIAAARAQVGEDHHAAARLHGLIAYETRIAAVHEWPFDQFTLLRVGAYVLIPAIPSVGEFLLKSFMERFTQ